MTKTEENIRGWITLILTSASVAVIVWPVFYGINWLLAKASIVGTNFMQQAPGAVVFAGLWAAFLALEIVLLARNKPGMPPS